MPLFSRTPPAFHSWPTIWQLKWYRVFKYKQRRQLKTRPALAPAHMPHIQIGACTGLSYGWIRQLRRLPNQSPQDRCNALNSDAAFANHDYLASVFNSHHAGGNYPARMANVAQAALGTNAGNVVNLNVVDFVNFTGLIGHLNTNPGQHLISMQLGGVNTNHLAAMSQEATQLRFFDPNFGEFVISNGNRLAFFQHLVTQYGTYLYANGTPQPVNFQAWDVSFLP